MHLPNNTKNILGYYQPNQSTHQQYQHLCNTHSQQITGTEDKTYRSRVGDKHVIKLISVFSVIYQGSQFLFFIKLRQYQDSKQVEQPEEPQPAMWSELSKYHCNHYQHFLPAWTCYVRSDLHVQMSNFMISAKDHVIIYVSLIVSYGREKVHSRQVLGGIILFFQCTM